MEGGTVPNKSGKPKKIPSSVYENIKWDFSEVADELERLRLEYAPDTLHNERFPLAWVLRADQRLTGLDDERDGKRPLTRAFEACGVTTGVKMAEMAGYRNGSTVSRWDVRSMEAETVQEHYWPGLCDAYCIARKQHTNEFSATFMADINAYVDGTRAPRDEAEARYMLEDIGFTRRCIESEVVWLFVCGGLDSHRNIASDMYTMAREGYRRAVALYAALMLSGGELGDLAHAASALVAQHIAAHGPTTRGEHDYICLSSKRGNLDFTADRYEEDGFTMPLHPAVSTNGLGMRRAAIDRATLRYASRGYLLDIEHAIHTELERRSKIGLYYVPELHAETEPTDEDGQNS